MCDTTMDWMQTLYDIMDKSYRPFGLSRTGTAVSRVPELLCTVDTFTYKPFPTL